MPVSPRRNETRMVQWRQLVLDYLRPRLGEDAKVERLAELVVERTVAEAERRGKPVEDGGAFRLQLLRQAHTALQTHADAMEDDPRSAAWAKLCVESDRATGLVETKPKFKKRGSSVRPLAIGITALLLLLIVAGGYWAWNARRVALIAKEADELVTVALAESKPETAVAPIAVLPPSPSAPGPQPIPPEPPAAIAEIPLQPLPPIQLALVAESEQHTFDDPAAELRLAPLDHQQLTLRGRVRRLVVEVVNGGSLLDASQLSADEIVFTRSINGGSMVKARAPHGLIQFLQDVNGQSHVELCAPGGVIEFQAIDGRSQVRVMAAGGQVRFGRPTDPTADLRSTINGESQVTVNAREVDLRGIVDGTHTRIEVTLSGLGSLRFHTLTGAARLFYEKDHPSDPNPTIRAGVVLANAAISPWE